MEHQFWFWNHKLNGILALLAQLSDYKLECFEVNTIKYNLFGTNDLKNQWAEYLLSGRKHQLNLKLAYDETEGSDMIHIKIKTNAALKEKIEMLDLFQSMFKKLELED